VEVWYSKWVVEWDKYDIAKIYDISINEAKIINIKEWKKLVNITIKKYNEEIIKLSLNNNQYYNIEDNKNFKKL